MVRVNFLIVLFVCSKYLFYSIHVNYLLKILLDHILAVLAISYQTLMTLNEQQTLSMNYEQVIEH